MSGQVKILRGISGSGKSTYAQQLVRERGATAVSADDFFTVDGRYRFDVAKIQDAHNSCVRAYLAALEARHALIVVDNTNCSAVEIAPYYALALAFGYEVEIEEFLSEE